MPDGLREGRFEGVAVGVIEGVIEGGVLGFFEFVGRVEAEGASVGSLL